MLCSLMSKLIQLEKDTAQFEGFILCLALDYGGKDELSRAAQKLVDSGTVVTDESFALSLDTAQLPELDLIIRTSGEQRLSGFMPYQSVYAELMFIDKHFPDFCVVDLVFAIDNFGERGRRFGK